MQDTDKDLEALEGLLGRASADYQALRHSGALQPDFEPARRHVRQRTYGIAASVLLIVSALTLAGGMYWPNTKTTVSSRLALAKPAMPLSLRPGSGLPKRISLSRLKPAKSLQRPRRPSGPKG